MRQRPAWLVVHDGAAEFAAQPLDATLANLRMCLAEASDVVRNALRLVEAIDHPDSHDVRHALAVEFGQILTVLARPAASLQADPDTLRDISQRLDIALAQLQDIAHDLQAK